jgi:NitT/TauT family transport system permease protein
MAEPVDHALQALKIISSTKFWRGALAIVVFIAIWEIASRADISKIPPPTSVAVTFKQLMADPSYWFSWYLSTQRVFAGFIAAMLLGIPLGLGMAVSRVFYGTVFPVFEVLRPIPPLAWVPASIIFWPTQELSIAFVTFLGAFYAVVINVIGGAQAIDTRYFQAARSMGSSNWDIFRRIILPGTLPSIMVGATVGIGIAWAVVVAAEMISGGGSAGSMGGAKGGGLGFFIWNSYVGGSYTQIVVGMISIGIAGYISSALLRKLGELATPWLREQ